MPSLHKFKQDKLWRDKAPSMMEAQGSIIHIVLSITLFMCPMFSSAMETKKSKASDFQIYQLLSFVVKNNAQFYFPTELVQIIITTACKITEEREKQELAEIVRQARLPRARITLRKK